MRVKIERERILKMYSFFFLFTFVFTLKGYFDMDDVKGVDYNGRYLFKLRNLLERLSRERESPFDVRK